MKIGLNDKMSPREQVAEALMETCVFGGLTDAYGVIKARSTANGKTYWSVTFCKARDLDGVIRIYSERFILIQWKTRYKSLPHTGQQKFISERQAKDFMCLHFINKG
jgi:hypothetical protein